MKNIFDLEDQDDIPSEVYLHLPKLAKKSDEFGKHIEDLFVEAKKEGLSILNAAQVTIAYYRKYTSPDVLIHGPDRVDIKNRYLVANKLQRMAKDTNTRIHRIDKGEYTLAGAGK